VIAAATFRAWCFKHQNQAAANWAAGQTKNHLMSKKPKKGAAQGGLQKSERQQGPDGGDCD
jgi:hypothetical protein